MQINQQDKSFQGILSYVLLSSRPRVRLTPGTPQISEAAAFAAVFFFSSSILYPGGMQAHMLPEHSSTNAYKKAAL